MVSLLQKTHMEIKRVQIFSCVSSDVLFSPKGTPSPVCDPCLFLRVTLTIYRVTNSLLFFFPLSPLHWLFFFYCVKTSLQKPTSPRITALEY